MEWNTLEELREELKKDNEVMDSRELHQYIAKDLEYSFKYAEDRSRHLKQVMNDKLYANCLSTQKYKSQQVKSTTDPLSEEESYTNHLDRLADYILRAPYDNQEDQEEAERLKLERQELKKIKDVDKRRKRAIANRDKQTNRSSLITNKRLGRSQREIVYCEEPSKDNEGKEDNNNQDNLFYKANQQKIHYTKKDKELNQKGNFKNNLNYWLHYGTREERTQFSMFDVDYSTPYYLIAYNSLAQQNESIGIVLNQISSTTNLKRIKELERLKRELTADYNVVANIFRAPVILSSSSFVENVDVLTLIEERIDYTDKKIVKAVVYGFSEMKQQYENKTSTLNWCILKDFEKALKEIKLSSLQRTVAEHIMYNPNWSYQDVIDDVSTVHNKVIGKTAIAYHIDNFINKLLKYFIEKEVS